MPAPATPVPGAIPTAIYNALNGVAIAAANNQDINTVSLLARIAEWLVQLNTAYTATAAAATPALLPPNGYPYNFANFDANAVVAKQLGIPGQQLGA